MKENERKFQISTSKHSEKISNQGKQHFSVENTQQGKFKYLI